MITCLGLSPALDVTYGVPLLTPGRIHRPSWKLTLPGGKSLNVARALMLLGDDPCAIAPLGGGSGAEIQRLLGESGVRTLPIETKEPTRTCVSIVHADDGQITELYEHAPPLASETWERLEGAIDRVSTGWLAVSGSVPAGGEDALIRALASAADSGARIALDVRGEALADALDAMPVRLVKVNRAEAEELVGPGEPVVLAQALRQRGAATAIVTDGAHGSVAADEAGLWRVGAPLAGRYTVGAGDCFLAGALHALDARAGLPAALRHAGATAAANTVQPGAALFDPADVAALLEQVEVDAL